MNPQAYLPGETDGPILVVGCGNGDLLARLGDLGCTDLVGVDPSQDRVDACRQRGLAPVECSDPHRFLDSDDRSWTCIVVVDFLAKLSKQEGVALVEVARDRLVPGGRLVVRVPNLSNPLNLAGRYSDFAYRVGFSKESLDQFLRICGFEIEWIRGEHRPHSSLLPRLLYDSLLWQAFQIFQRRTMHLKADVERGENLWGVGRKAA